MNKQKMKIWGRSFELDIVFDCYEDEQVLPVQEEALERFLQNPQLPDEAKKAVEEYCLKRNSEEIGKQVIDNIFKYVMPQSVYIQRTSDNSRVVGLMCAYKFDAEHGIAVVFKNEKFDKTGSQDLIL